jgi:peptide/nickel transport system substrate-binding protein
MSDDKVARLIEEATRLRWNRRQILKRAAVFGLSAPAISAVLAACGGDDDDDDDGGEPTATTEGAAAATPTSGGAATTPTAADSSPTAGGADASPTTGAAATTATSADTGGRGGIINMNTTNGDSGIGNPIIASSVTLIEYYVFSRLMIYDDEGTLQPELAEDWSYSDDNLELTITLRQGVTWHDGEAFTADDVIFTLDTIADEATDTNQRSKLQVGGEFVAWEKVDDYTVKFTTPEPFAPFLFNIQDIEIIPEHILSASSDINTDPFNRAPVGTGFFKLVEWEPDQFVRLEPNPDYWAGPPRCDGLTVFFHADTNVGSAALDAGEIDMMFTPPELQPRYEEQADDFTLFNYVYYTPITLAFNHKHPLLQDLVLRQAVQMAIDKVTLTETVTKGRGIVANNQFAETGPLDRYNDYDNVTAPEFNVEQANAMLDEAGYTLGDDGVRTKDGQRLSFNVITYSGFEEYVNDQIILQEMLGEIGIELTPQVVDFATLESMWADPNDDPANRALEIEEWPHPFEFDPDLYNELHSDNHPPNLNYMWFADDEVDALIEQGRTTTDPDRRVEIYKELDVRRAATIPSVPLYNAVDGWVVSKRVQNVKDTTYFRRYVYYGPRDWWKES